MSEGNIGSAKLLLEKDTMAKDPKMGLRARDG